MKRLVLTFALALCALLAWSQTIEYKGETVQLGPKAFYVDGSLSDADAAKSPYIFNDFNQAMAALTDGSAAQPMRVYIAPWVYWVDDPDDPQVRRNPNGGSPIGLTVRCNALQLLGMSSNPKDVVLASARGQSQGSYGNFTMFDFYGDDLVVKDLTMGNYCNIDLVYPRNPEFNRPKRNSAITQAQLAFAHGDRAYAENVRFEARLNLSPLTGARRLLFVNCHMECTDDALARNGVYLGCDIDFWGRQPFGSVDTYGTVFMDCEFNICHSEPVQAISKGVGRHSLIDCDYTAGRPVYLAWTFRPEEWLRCYQYNLTIDGQPAFVGAAKPYNTVLLDQSAQLGAYRLIKDDGTVLYNTYNLLRGEDDWDPQGIKSEVEAISRRDGVDYTNIATCLNLDQRFASLQTGAETVTVKAEVMRHNGYKLNNQKVLWKVQPGYERFVELSAAEGYEVTVKATNTEDQTRTFALIAQSEDGLESAVQLTVAPDFVEAPAFIAEPKVSVTGGKAVVSYELDLKGRADESVVIWYRCTSSKGDGAIPVLVANDGKPRTSYTLTSADVGYYIMVGVSPKHLRCHPGEEKRVVYKTKIRSQAVTSTNVLKTDFSDFACANQPLIKPGFWTIDAYKPADTHEYSWEVNMDNPCWTYGTGINGASHGYGIQQLQQGARLRYTPVKGKYGDMSVSWKVSPAKDGGQGFASARQQYLDLFIKFDTQNLTGYALRVIRTTKYANAVDVLLVKYTQGVVEPISESVTVDCFLTDCTIDVKMEGHQLSAEVAGPGRIVELAEDPNVKHSASLTATVEPNEFGGIGLQHTSTVGTESRILIHSVEAAWE